MPKKKLTDAAVQKLTAEKGQRVDYFDVTLPGFGLRVSGPTPRNPEGRRSWMLFYRFGGEQKRLTLEPGYPAMGLGDARKAAGDALALLDKGQDPAAAKAAVKAEAARKRDTFQTVMDEFIKRHMEGKRRSPRYVEDVRRNFSNHVLPRWADRDIKSITRRDVIELLDAIVDKGTDVKGADGKKKHVKGGPISANRVLAAVRALFNWALRRGLIESTPASLVERPGEENQRERVLTADELRVIWTETAALGTPVIQFFRTAMMLGQRREETAGMRWADLDLEDKVWTIPAEMTKAGRLHIVPLPQAVADMLKAMPHKTFLNAKNETELSLYVFTGNGKAPISGYSAIKKRLDAKVTEARKKAEVADIAAWTLHDLRRTVATEMARLGVARLTISKVLNHADRSVTGIYDRHGYLAEKRHALETWATYLDGLVNPRPDNVVELRPAVAL
jgi:integrase